MTPHQISVSAVALAASCVSVASPARLRLGPQGEIMGWLVAGPFPNIGALERKGTGFAADYLGEEASATASEGTEIPALAFEKSADPHLIVARKPGWQLGLGSVREGIDLARMLNGSKPGIAYCYTELESRHDVDAKLLFGSDDGARVWLNGEVRFAKQVARGIKRDEDAVPIHLRKGINRLLFKVEQGDGGWGLLARITAADGTALRTITQILNIQPANPSDGEAEAWLRRTLRKPGTFDVAAAQLYLERSKRAARWVARFQAEAAKPKVLEGVLHTEAANVAAAAASPGSADELSTALASAAQAIEADFKRVRQPLLKATQRADALVKTNVAAEDYVRVMPEGRYFVHADGKPFLPIGYNHNPDWSKFEEANPDAGNYDPGLPDRYLAHLKSKGVNVVRMMIETPPSGNLEDPIGVFSPEHVRWIDTVFLAARKHGVKILLTPWDTFWMNLRWEKTPYNPDNGGLVENRIDFITSPAVRKQQKRRLEFLINRWGNTGTIFAWELLNEADLWWGADAHQLTEWTNDIAQFVRTHEKKKWGRNHMLSVSFAEAMPKGDMAHLAYNSNLLDYATTHLYIGTTRAPKEAPSTAGGIAEGVRYAMAQIHDVRPFMDTENGPIDKWVESATLDAEVFHNMTWSHLANGGAGSGFRWPYRNPHHLTEAMLDHLKSFATFVDGVDWKPLAGRRVPLTVDGHAYGFGTAHSAMVWSMTGGSVNVTWPEGPSEVTGQLFDTHSGKWLRTITAKKVNGSYSLADLGATSVAIVLSTSK